MLVNENAYSQMSNTLLPARFGQGLLAQAALGDAGEKLSTMSYSLFSRSNDKPRMFRVSNITDPYTGQRRECLRAQLSQGYGLYNNLTFVEDMLDNAPELADAPVLDYRVTDVGMRLRFALEPLDRIEVHKPVAMCEAWNSEVGRRRCGLGAGIWMLDCTNGMSHWDSRQDFAWYHRGDSGRIRQGVKSAVTEIRTSASGVVEAYNSALTIAVDDAYAWMEAQLKQEKATKSQIVAAQAALTHETTTPGGLLASVVDATTLIAQDYDLFEQAELERSAARILRRGRATALRNGGRIPMPATA